jgi:hypothetical protein
LAVTVLKYHKSTLHGVVFRKMDSLSVRLRSGSLLRLVQLDHVAVGIGDVDRQPVDAVMEVAEEFHVGGLEAGGEGAQVARGRVTVHSI